MLNAKAVLQKQSVQVKVFGNTKSSFFFSQTLVQYYSTILLQMNSYTNSLYNHGIIHSERPNKSKKLTLLSNICTVLSSVIVYVTRKVQQAEWESPLCSILKLNNIYLQFTGQNTNENSKLIHSTGIYKNIAAS